VTGDADPPRSSPEQGIRQRDEPSWASCRHARGRSPVRSCSIAEARVVCCFLAAGFWELAYFTDTARSSCSVSAAGAIARSRSHCVSTGARVFSALSGRRPWLPVESHAHPVY